MRERRADSGLHARLRRTREARHEPPAGRPSSTLRVRQRTATTATCEPFERRRPGRAMPRRAASCGPFTAITSGGHRRVFARRKTLTTVHTTMHTVSFSLLLVVLCAAPAAASENAGKLDALVKRYLDGLLRAKPHLATFMGDHRFDGTLPDRSAAGEQKRIAELVGQEAELAAIVQAGDLGDDSRIDAQIVADGIALELLYLREIREWEWDPRI